MRSRNSPMKSPDTKTSSTPSPMATALTSQSCTGRKTDRICSSPINEDLYLLPEAGYSPFGCNAVPVKPLPSFSFFKAPATNKTSHKSSTLLDDWNYITGHYAQAETEKLHSIEDKNTRHNYKASYFAYSTFSGVVSERVNDKLVEHSGYRCLKFDNVKDLDALKRLLLDATCSETKLMFRSPSGEEYPGRYRLQAKLQLTMSGKGCHPCMLRNYLADASCDSAVVHIRVPNDASIIGGGSNSCQI